jgi:hypothetical protein
MQALLLKPERLSHTKIGEKLGICPTTLRRYFDAQVSAYVKDIQAGLEELNGANSQSPEERRTLFLMKKRLIDALLEEVAIDGDRQIHTKFRADLANLVVDNKKASSSQVNLKINTPHCLITAKLLSSCSGCFPTVTF